MPLPRSVLRMTDDELESFLNTERTARVGTTSPDGEPHVAPLWFVWRDGKIYFNSLKRSRRDADVRHGSRVSVCATGCRRRSQSAWTSDMKSRRFRSTWKATW